MSGKKRKATAPASGATESEMPRAISYTMTDEDGNVALPRDILQFAGFHGVMLIEAELTEQGILLRPHAGLDPEQARAWRRQHEAAIKQQLDDIAAGRKRVFYSEEEFEEALRRETPANADV